MHWEPIPPVGGPTSHAYLVGDVCVFAQEHLQLTDADAEVSICELIGDVEPQRPKLFPLQHVPMEEAK